VGNNHPALRAPLLLPEEGSKIAKKGGFSCPPFFLFHNKKENKINRII